ncbi:MAG: hypothetical protein AAB499_02235 [Patescibacteria group bacterium]
MPSKKTKSADGPVEPVEVEKLSEQEAEPVAHHQSEPSNEEATLDEEAIKATEYQQATDTDQVIPAEVAAIHIEKAATINEAEGAVSKLARRKIKKVVRQTVKAAKVARAVVAEAPKSKRSRRYLAAKGKIEPGKFYPLDEAIELTKELSFAKFDAAVELHLNIIAKKSKAGTESSRGQLNLPHAPGKEKKIVVLTNEIIEAIAKTKKIDFDVAIASPALMPQVAKIARILGPKGKMPDPKSGTVTDDPESLINQIRAGKIEYRLDGNNLHQIIGRCSWPNDKLAANANAVIGVFGPSRLRRVVLVSSIGPAVPVRIK